MPSHPIIFVCHNTYIISHDYVTKMDRNYMIGQVFSRGFLKFEIISSLSLIQNDFQKRWAFIFANWVMSNKLINLLSLKDYWLKFIQFDRMVTVHICVNKRNKPIVEVRSLDNQSRGTCALSALCPPLWAHEVKISHDYITKVNKDVRVEQCFPLIRNKYHICRNK